MAQIVNLLSFLNNISPFWFLTSRVKTNRKKISTVRLTTSPKECAIQPQYISFKYHFKTLSDVSPKISRGKEISGINLLGWFRHEIKKSKTKKLGEISFAQQWLTVACCFGNPFHFFSHFGTCFEFRWKIFLLELSMSSQKWILLIAINRTLNASQNRFCEEENWTQ